MRDSALDETTGRSGIDAPDDRSPGRAVAVAVGLGVLGPLIALVSVAGVGLINAVAGLGLIALVVLGLFFGQYVAFAGLAVGYLAARGLDGPGIRSYLGVGWPSLREVGLVIGGWLAILVLLTVVGGVVSALGAETASNQSAELASENPGIIPVLIAASFLVIGPCEELLYRGAVQGRLRESLPAVPSIVIASAIFAAVHVMALTGGVGARLTTVALLFVPSLVLGGVYEYTGNIVVPALLHGLHNAVLFTALYVVVTSGGELPDPGTGTGTGTESAGALAGALDPVWLAALLA